MLRPGHAVRPDRSRHGEQNRLVSYEVGVHCRSRVIFGIPTPGVVALSARLVASIAATAVCGLLVILWIYRRRDFILRWAAGWALTASALLLLSRADVSGGLTPSQLVVAGTTAVCSCVLYLSGIRRYLGGSGWSRESLATAATAATFVAVAEWRGGTPIPVFVATLLAMAAVLAVSAWSAAGIARERRFVGAGVMAAAFGLVACMATVAAVAVAAGRAGTAPSRVLLAVNAGAFLMVAFGQHLFVFEDMLLDLRESNRELSAAREELRVAAITDPLTGLYNRRFLDEVTPHHLEHHRRFQLPLSLLYVDLDRFKAVNDTDGHAVGDRVLRHVADAVRQTFREADYVFRVGGDEFVVLMSCALGEADRRVRTLQTGFHATLVEAGLPLSLGLSVGATQVSPDARDLSRAMAEADQRMYEDKRRRATG